jgi:hypothetical protein
MARDRCPVVLLRRPPPTVTPLSIAAAEKGPSQAAWPGTGAVTVRSFWQLLIKSRDSDSDSVATFPPARAGRQRACLRLGRWAASASDGRHWHCHGDGKFQD